MGNTQACLLQEVFCFFPRTEHDYAHALFLNTEDGANLAVAKLFHMGQP